MEKEILKYSNDQLTVIWEPKKCIHSKKCWKNLNEVFKPSERPWVQVNNARPERIMEQIDCCPSGALSYTK